MAYFEKEDIFHLTLSNEREVGSVEISPNIEVWKSALILRWNSMKRVN